MQFDWVTWSIWAVGLVITIIWVIVPAREFLGIVRLQRDRYRARVQGRREGGAGEAQ